MNPAAATAAATATATMRNNFGSIAFATAVLAITADDISFKVLCDAWPGTLSLFVATASPVLLAATLVPLFGVALRLEEWRRRRRAREERAEVPSNADDRNDTTSGSIIRFRLFRLLRPSGPHVALAALDHGSTLLFFAAGSNAPGHLQVLINQSSLPLTAAASFLALGRRYSLTQCVASAIILAGAALAGTGSLLRDNDDNDNASDNDSDNDNDNDNDGGEATVRILGRTASVALFFLAQFPNAASAVWKEHLLKETTDERICERDDGHIDDDDDNEGEEEGEKQEDLPRPLRVTRLATRIALIRASIAVLFSLASSVASSTVSDSTTRGFRRLISNENNAAVLLLINDMTYVCSKLTNLLVSSSTGGAFLSVLAGAVALPLQVWLFCSLRGESSDSLTLWGLVLTMVGMALYVRAVPKEFGADATMRCVSADRCYDTVDMSQSGDDRAGSSLMMTSLSRLSNANPLNNATWSQPNLP